MEVKKTKVFVAIPTTGQVVDSQAYILRDIAELYKDQIELVYSPICVRRIFHDFARNKLVEEFLATDCDIMWFLDSDITPPVHIMDLVALHKDKWEAAGAVYPIFMSVAPGELSEVLLTCYNTNPSTGSLGLSSVPKKGTQFVDGLATGCLFLKRELFSKLEKPYFAFRYKEDMEIAEGEDISFANKLRKLNIKFFTDFDLVCKHQKSVDLLDVNNYAINYSNNTVQAYHDRMKEHVRGVTKEAFQKGYETALQAISANSSKREVSGSIIQPKKTLWTP